MEGTLYNFQYLKENGSFDQCDSSLMQLLQNNDDYNNNNNNNNMNNNKVEWYYKNDDYEYECYGFDESIELETKYQSYLNGTGNEYFEIQSGYFSNCYDKHYINFKQLNQYNYDQKETRKIIRTLNNNEFNNNFLQIRSNKQIMSNNFYNELLCIDDIARIRKREYCELQRNVLSQVYCGGDAIQINIASIRNNIINESLFVAANKYDIPIASIQINNNKKQTSNDYHQQIDLLLDSFINYQYKTTNNVSMDIVKLYNQCNIKLNSSMISYLVSNEKVNFILYDTDYQLLAIGKYHGPYIHKYDNNNSMNPYQYESFLEFHSLLTSFYELSLMQCLNNNNNNNNKKTGLQINCLISCFNKKIRSCLSYNNNYTFWTPSINKQEIFKQIININRVITVQNIIKEEAEYGGYEEEEEEEDDESSEPEIVSLCDEILFDSSSCSNCDDNDYGSDYSESTQYESSEEASECIICCEKVDIEYNHYNDNHHNHKDIHVSCLLKWRENGHDTCPKCGI